MVRSRTTEVTHSLLQKMKHMFFPVLTVYADGEDPSTTVPATPPANPPVYTDEFIARVRREEKDKLYGKIKSLEDTNTSLATRVGELTQTVASLTKQLSDAEKKSAAGGEVSKENETLKAEVERLKAAVANAEKAVTDTETRMRTEFELSSYKQQKIAEAQGKLIPELVSGKTKEEIDASIESSKQRFTELFGQAAPNAATPQNPLFPAATSPAPAGSTTPAPAPAAPQVPPANTSTAPLTGANISLEELSKMDVRSPQYAELRKQLGL